MILAGDEAILPYIWSENWKLIPMNTVIMDLLLYKYCRICPENIVVDIIASRQNSTFQELQLATFCL